MAPNIETIVEFVDVVWSRIGTPHTEPTAKMVVCLTAEYKGYTEDIELDAARMTVVQEACDYLETEVLRFKERAKAAGERSAEKGNRHSYFVQTSADIVKSKLNDIEAAVAEILELARSEYGDDTERRPVRFFKTEEMLMALRLVVKDGVPWSVKEDGTLGQPLSWTAEEVLAWTVGQMLDPKVRESIMGYSAVT